MLHSRSTVDVRFYELNPYNHLNHTVYLAYCEVGRIEAVERRGIGMQTLDELGYRVIVVDLVARFIAAAVAGDRLDVVAEVVRIRRAGNDWRHRIEREGQVLFTADVRAAMTDRAGSPIRVPDFVQTALSQ